MSNKRVLLTGVGAFSRDEQMIPRPPDSGVVVKIINAGICHSDIHAAFTPNYHPALKFPRVIGHEISGEIYEMSDEAKKERPDLVTGDKVVVFPWVNCNNCNFCNSDCSYCSISAYGGGTCFVYGISIDGGYQQYVQVHFPKYLVKLPDGFPMDQAAILACSGVTAYNASHKIREAIEVAKKANGHAHVAVVGAGAVGLWGIQCINYLFSPNITIVAVDIDDQKLEDAKSQGAHITHKWGSTESGQEAADQLVKAVGARMDAVVDFVGAAAIVERCFLSLNLGGTLCLVGLGGKELPAMTLGSVIRRSVSIRGSIVGTLKQVKELIQLVADKKIVAPPTFHVTMSDVEDVMQKLKQSKQRGRAVMVMESS